ncbi:ABC transporter ATP-binding protein [Pseudoprimorskyibacter insulae]|uniref:Putative ABC transporter ATP-binding protein n=1 Tax=Pseudoprimorskyibacter insulae TaxID=1695997 RepID=A0A2R8B0F4_9RHOB|nr:ABC transporter ATP-binding protein [Pseudoprimorskyibacter insulae]SPF81697.1 putative ABC transporter ATP-binding protein [Pseudoprimorskyibacter insulae]
MTGLIVEQISHDWGQKRALDEVSFAIEPGRFCALLGPNGAGKSTLFGLITRLFTPRSGWISVAGHRMDQAPLVALGQMGVVFQQQTLDLDLTVWRNMLYFAGLHGITGKAARLAAHDALDRLGMAERRGEKVRALNGGHRRRLEIARALMHGPKVLLLDEPTVGLDAQSRQSIVDHVHTLAREDGLSVLWATHLTDEVLPGDQLVILHQGKIREVSTSSQTGPDLTAHFLSITGQDRAE